MMYKKLGFSGDLKRKTTTFNFMNDFFYVLVRFGLIISIFIFLELVKKFVGYYIEYNI